MTKLYGLIGLISGLVLSAGVYAGDVVVDGAWSRATAPGQSAGMVDATITSKQGAVLIGASSKVASSVELHSMTHEGGMMKMREVDSITLPAGKPVNLGESGYHLMLIGLKAPLKAGAVLPLTLNVRTDDKRELKIEVSAEVKPMNENKAEEGHGEHMHHHH